MSTETLRFLAHAAELEADAMTRYEELADALQVHNNPEVAAFFAQMATESGHHLAEVQELAGGRPLPDIPAWEFDWEQDAPESLSYEAPHYRMSLGEALQLALANERSAGAFYAGYAESSTDPETVALARRFAEEEAEHARRLEQRLADTPENGEFRRQDDDSPHMPE
jgi:rubrerythrin